MTFVLNNAFYKLIKTTFLFLSSNLSYSVDYGYIEGPDLENSCKVRSLLPWGVGGGGGGGNDELLYLAKRC